MPNPFDFMSGWSGPSFLQTFGFQWPEARSGGVFGSMFPNISLPTPRFLDIPMGLLNARGPTGYDLPLLGSHNQPNFMLPGLGQQPRSTQQPGGYGRPAQATQPPGTQAPSAPPTPINSSDWVSAIVNQNGLMGKGYVWGGKTPAGFDCSGLTAWLWQQQGKSIGAGTSGQWGNSRNVAVTADQLAPGDLVFYNMDDPSPYIQHVAVYIGNGQVVQSGGSASNVNVAPVNQRGVGTISGYRRPT